MGNKMSNVSLTVHFFSSEDGTSWAALSNGVPRFVLYDVSEKKLEAQVERALKFYRQNYDEIKAKVQERERSLDNWKPSLADLAASDIAPKAEFSRLVQKTALIDSSDRIAINATSQDRPEQIRAPAALRV